MATKKAKKNGRALVPAKLTESARSVWLAGVGALAEAEHRGGRMVTGGEKLFERLIREGKAYEAKNRKRLATMLDQVKDNVRGAGADVGAMVEKVTGRVGGRVTSPINDALAGALHRLGVPTRKEIATLTKRVEALTRAVERSGTRRAKPEAGSVAVE